MNLRTHKIPGWSSSHSVMAGAQKKFNQPGGTAGKTLAGGFALRNQANVNSIPPHRIPPAECAGQATSRRHRHLVFEFVIGVWKRRFDPKTGNGDCFYRESSIKSLGQRLLQLIAIFLLLRQSHAPPEVREARVRAKAAQARIRRQLQQNKRSTPVLIAKKLRFFTSFSEAFAGPAYPRRAPHLLPALAGSMIRMRRARRAQTTCRPMHPPPDPDR